MIVLALVMALAGISTLFTTAPVASAHTTQATSTYCLTYHADSGFWWGPVYAHPNIDVQLCNNGTSIWRGSWGPDCYVGTGLGGSSSNSWCGVYNNGGSFVEPGVNYSVTYSYGGVSLTCHGYFRMHVNASNPISAYSYGGLSCF